MIIGGQSLVSAPPAFSNDGKKLLVCTGNTVSVFSTATGMLVCELEGHNSRVTSIVVVPAEPTGVKFLCYCWTSSLDGSICYWDFSGPELIKKVSVQLPIFSMVIPNLSHSSFESSGKKSSLHAFISVEDTMTVLQKKALSGMIHICDLNRSRIVGGVLTETRKPEYIVISPSKEYIGIPNKRKIHIWRIPVSTSESYIKDIRMIKLHHTKKFSTLAFHPTQRIVAAGDVTGRILIWRGFGDKKFFGKKVVDGEDDADSSPTTWHWHASEVKLLLFSSDGAYLYSGAKEGVIVVWQLDTGKKNYKPRLGSPLLYYTPSLDPSLSCVSCADNQIHILKMPTMEIMKTVSGIRPPFSFSEMPADCHGGLAFNCAAGVVALPTQNYCVQLYSLFDDKEVSQVQVCERNYQPVEETAVYVDRVSLSVDGALMATVDVKLSEEDIGAMVTLKFWSFDDRIRKYALSTVIYEPHCDAGISDLSFHPVKHMAVTTSYCGEFKIWVHTSDTWTVLSQKTGWRCQSIGSYKKKPMTSAAFSADGSVLAVAVEKVVTLWDPINNVLVSVVGETKMPISRLYFVGSSEYLLTVSNGLNAHLTLWSMSRLSVLWSYNLLVEAVACKSDGSGFAVLVECAKLSKYSSADHKGFILVFNLKKEVPIAIWSVNKVRGGGLAFIQSENSLHQDTAGETTPSVVLAYLNSDREFIVFDPYGDERQHIGEKSFGNRDMDVETEELHGYASIYGKLPTRTVKKDQISAAPYLSSRPWETMFDGSSHALPPLTKLCASFLESLLEKKVNTEQ